MTSSELLTREQRAFYLDRGYLVVEGIISPRRLSDLRNALESRYAVEGDRAGSEGVSNPGVRRLCNLLSKGRALEQLAVEPTALEVARLTIGNDIRWQAMNFHDPVPGDVRAHQAIHADRSFFSGCTGYITVAWAIDDMNEANGATRVVPGSHREPWPGEVLDDPRAPVPGEIYVACPAGSALFIHGDVWHGGRANDSSGSRRVIHLGFSCPNTAPQYEIAGTLTAEIRERLREHLDLVPATLESFGHATGEFAGRNVDQVMQEASVLTR